MKPKYVIFTLCLLFAGCVHKKRTEISPVEERYHLSYSVVGQRSAGLLNVFDDGERTYVKVLPELMDRAEKPRALVGSNEVAMVCEKGGYCVLNEVVPQFIVSSSAGTAFIKREQSGHPLLAKNEGAL